MIRLYRGRGMPTGNLQLSFKYAGKERKSTTLMKATDKIHSGKKISFGIPPQKDGDSKHNRPKSLPKDEPFRVKLFHRHFPNIQGYAYVSFECIPLAFAQSERAGQGRSSPNKRPKLETPGPIVCCGCKSRWIQGLKSRLTNCLSRKRTLFILALIAVILFFLLIPLLQDSF